MNPTLNCAEFEIALCDVVDGTLHGEALQAFEAHRAGCPACALLAADALDATAFVLRVSSVEPPRELITRILYHTASQKAGAPVAPRKGVLFGWLGPLLQPKLAMGMAMTILSVSMLAQLSGIEMRQLRASDLDPVKIWASLDDQAHLTWSRVVKYYENIRVVYEIQSRLKEWTEQEELERQNQLKAKPEAAAQEKR